MYHQQTYKHSGVVVSAGFGSHSDSENNDIDVTEAVGGAYEMRNSGKESVACKHGSFWCPTDRKGIEQGKGGT